MEGDKELYKRQIKIVDVQIDRLVYELYGLTEEAMNRVEGRVSEYEELYETSASELQ